MPKPAAEGAEDVILRSRIRSLESSGKSLMPEELEKEMSAADMADLLEFVLRGLPPNGDGGEERKRS